MIEYLKIFNDFIKNHNLDMSTFYSVSINPGSQYISVHATYSKEFHELLLTQNFSLTLRNDMYVFENNTYDYQFRFYTAQPD